MIGLVLVSHGNLADEFRGAVEHVMGKQDQLETVAIGPDDDIDTRGGDILNAAGRVDTGEGVIICTDMFGGTPSNLAIAAMGAREGVVTPHEANPDGIGIVPPDGGPIEVLAGMNLPMLVKLAGVRARAALPECALIGQEAGRKYINVASRVLNGK